LDATANFTENGASRFFIFFNREGTRIHAKKREFFFFTGKNVDKTGDL
jgi:hypothetical protein